MNDIIVEQEITDQQNCVQCSEAIAANSRYCKYCGCVQSADAAVSGKKWDKIKQVALFYSVDIAICCLAQFIHTFRTLVWSLFFDVLMAIIAVAFFCSNWSENKSILVWRNFSILKLIAYGTIAVLGSLIVNYSVTWLNQSLFSREMYYYGLYSKHRYGKELMVFSIAVMPALFEELGYRGYLLQNLLHIVDKKQAMFITAFLFAIIHMSFISLFWLIPFALLLGYVRVKENTLWYGVFMHFCFNLTVCVLELWKLGVI